MEKEVAVLDQQINKIIHVDMDYFYAQVEIRDNPKLKGKPLIISGPPNMRSVICTASYEARKLGVHAGMSATLAFKKHPELLYVVPNFDKYIKVSAKMHEIFKRYSDIIEPLSLDEAYIDVTNNKINSKSAYKIAMLIQRDIKNELNLTCSIGVSYNKFLAKIGSDFNKPYAITVITPNDAQSFINELDISKFPGVGKKSLFKFHDYGIFTGSDLAKYSKEELYNAFGKQGQSLYYKAQGIDYNKVNTKRNRKSYGKERTYQTDIISYEKIIELIEQYSRNVYKILKKDNKIAFTVNIKIRYNNFETITRSHTCKIPFKTEELLIKEAVKLFEKNYQLKPIRLLGVSVSNVVEDTNIVYYEQIYLKLYKRGQNAIK